MSKSPQRGRTTKMANKAAPISMFYLLLGIIVLAGAGTIGYFIFSNQQRLAAPSTPAAAVPAAPTVPTGITADGLPYKGEATAPVTVTEFSDYQ
jgi:hypothetical protein